MLSRGDNAFVFFLKRGLSSAGNNENSFAGAVFLLEKKSFKKNEN